MLHEILTDRATWIIAALLLCCLVMLRAAWLNDRARSREEERQAAIKRLSETVPGQPDYQYTPVAWPLGFNAFGDVVVYGTTACGACGQSWREHPREVSTSGRGALRYLRIDSERGVVSALRCEARGMDDVTVEDGRTVRERRSA